MPIQTTNPATGQIIKVYQEMARVEVDKIINVAHQTFLRWQDTSLAQRCTIIRNIEKILLDKKEIFAALITEEMGKPIKNARSEIEKCAWLCNHYAEHAKEYLKVEYVKTEMNKSYVMFQPLGVILAIMPWNFPFWQVFRFAVPTFLAGNTCVLKHAPITSGCGLEIEKIFYQAEPAMNLLQTLIIDTDHADQIIEHPKIRGVSLTGSVQAGKIVGAKAASNLKKAVLELGGSDPYLILEDADLDYAAEICVKSRLSNSGQVCIAAKRIIVLKKIHDVFLKKILAQIEHYQLGNPMDENTTLGPLARHDLRENVDQQVKESIANGAKLILGGQLIPGPGFYYPPTVLTNVKPGMPAYDAEIFGPVISIISAHDEQDAIAIANDSTYGLGAAVFTTNSERGEQIAKQLEVGSCAINTLVASDPRLPFGGVKSSGLGRELGAEGIKEFTNIKTINVK